MRSDQDIAAFIEKAAFQTFDRHLIVGARARRDIDHDGDPIFWARLVVEPGFMALEPDATIAFAARLRFDLVDMGELAFPVLEYVLRKDDEIFGDQAA